MSAEESPSSPIGVDPLATVETSISEVTTLQPLIIIKYWVSHNVCLISCK